MHRVPLVAIMEDEEFSNFHDSVDLSMPLLRRSQTVHAFSQCLMMDDKSHADPLEESTVSTTTSTTYATEEVINDMPAKIDASKLMKVPATPTKKAKRTKHRRSNCVFI
jgi:hypothetical protein